MACQDQAAEQRATQQYLAGWVGLGVSEGSVVDDDSEATHDPLTSGFSEHGSPIGKLRAQAGEVVAAPARTGIKVREQAWTYAACRQQTVDVFEATVPAYKPGRKQLADRNEFLAQVVCAGMAAS